MRRFSRFSKWLIVLGVILLLPSFGHTDEPASRPESWAVKLDRPGLPNLHKVSDGLYRGAQPTAEGIKELEKLGVKTIVCLRDNHSDKDLIGDAKIAYEHIPMKTWDVEKDDVVRFLKIATDKSRQPVFVHCQHGSDRTGTMCAAYRVVVDGWTKKEAIDEMKNGGFGFHSIWINLPKTVEKLDVEKIKAKLKNEAVKK
jgi:protein tyrosine/serine phosphatase